MSYKKVLYEEVLYEEVFYQDAPWPNENTSWQDVQEKS